MNKLLVICGPTATGKTSLAVKLAEKFNGEVVSADSRQVYRYMDIGTGKDLEKFSIFNLQFSIDKLKVGYYSIEKVPVWLYDVVEPDYQFSVADYVKCANLVIEDICKRGKLPILVGGTGFYIKALVDGIETLGIPPDWKLRSQLESWTAEQLANCLKRLDYEKWERLNKSDRSNPRRLIRAIEISIVAKKNNLKIVNCKFIENCKLKIENLLMIGLKAPNKIIYQRIDKRVEARVKQGVVEEIQGLLKKGYSWENSVLGETIGYREFRPYFKGRISLEEAIQRWKFDEHHYARRQMTWFKKDKRIKWFDMTEKEFEKNLEKLVKAWYIKNNA